VDELTLVVVDPRWEAAGPVVSVANDHTAEALAAPIGEHHLPGRAAGGWGAVVIVGVGQVFDAGHLGLEANPIRQPERFGVVFVVRPHLVGRREVGPSAS